MMHSRLLLQLGLSGARGFSPASLFANGEAGITVLPGTSFARNYQERTGASATTLCGVGDPCGTHHCLITGNYATAPSDAARPLFQGNYLQFDGTDDCLETAVVPATAISIFAAVRSTVVVKNHIGAGSTTNGTILSIDASGKAQVFHGTLATNNAAGTTTITSDDHVIGLRGDGSSVDVWVDGVQENTASSGATDTQYGICIGGWNRAGTLIAPMAGRIYGVVLFQDYITNANAIALQRYFAARAGIAL